METKEFNFKSILEGVRMSRAIIRCLFGDPMGEVYWSLKKNNGIKNPLGEDITIEVMSDYELEDFHYFVMGYDNAELMHRMGVKNLHLVSKEKNLVPHPAINPLYNKVYLIQQAMQQFDEILFVDFDSIPLKKPDEIMWKYLYEKCGRFNGSFIAPVVRRRFKQLLTKYQGGFRSEEDDLNFIINTCLVYCNDKKWIDNWLDHFDKYRKEVGEDITKHDEYILMYYLDKEVGVMSEEETIRNFNANIVHTQFQIELGNDIYFSHLAKSQRQYVLA